MSLWSQYNTSFIVISMSTEMAHFQIAIDSALGWNVQKNIMKKIARKQLKFARRMHMQYSINILNIQLT